MSSCQDGLCACILYLDLIDALLPLLPCLRLRRSLFTRKVQGKVEIYFENSREAHVRSIGAWEENVLDFAPTTSTFLFFNMLAVPTSKEDKVSDESFSMSRRNDSFSCNNYWINSVQWSWPWTKMRFQCSPLLCCTRYSSNSFPDILNNDTAEKIERMELNNECNRTVVHTPLHA